MPNRTQIVVLHEGVAGRSIDGVFIRALLKALDPPWIRPWKNNIVRSVPCGGRASLVTRMPDELKACIGAGGKTTLMVWADLDHDMANGDQLKSAFRAKAAAEGITDEQFEKVVFVFAKDRLENWIEFLTTGTTDESKEGPRVGNDRQAADAARLLAKKCQRQAEGPRNPPSLEWSCLNWRKLLEIMRD